MLDTIARNGERLIDICNDLLLLGNLDSGAAALERDHVDLGAMLDHVAESIRAAAERARPRTPSSTGLPEPVRVLGDRIQLERAITNLLSNAVKFTEDGGEVRCRLERRPDEAWLVVRTPASGSRSTSSTRCSRSSSGPRPPRSAPSRAPASACRSSPGIVAAHGGRIGVESAHLAGTTFTVRLPLAVA